jgi:putative membrane protein
MMYDWNNQGHRAPWDQGTPWEHWLMFALMVLFTIAVIVAIMYVARLLKQTSATNGTAAVTPAAAAAKPGVGAIESPQDILKRRYAAGEIEREEYLQKLGDL